jgi:hypothetical protein
MGRRVWRSSRCIITTVFLTLLAGCADTNDGPREEGGGVCALDARLDGRSYVANGGIRVIPALGEPLGTATVPPCEGDGYTFQAVSIVGVDPEVAFVDPGREDIIFLAEGIGALPPELMRLRREPRCRQKDAPIHVRGPWLGIIGPHEKTEVDLLPPYQLEMRVDRASVPSYERAFLTIRVAADAGRLLTREDVRTSLWEGGSLSVTVTCLRGRFWAHQASAHPPA